ncbi:MAG: hypothetical protein IPO21_00390 [Bacteroidales bacterium]|nr:hypothetical protein [Bacteroidales bacterium]
MGNKDNARESTVVSSFASPHMPTLNGEALSNTFKNQLKLVSKPKAYKRASAFTMHLAKAISSNAQKNKINLCFVDSLVQIDNDKKIKLNK